MGRTLGILIAIGITTLSAQAPQTSQPLRFEVASIKPRTSDDRTPFRVAFEPGGRFVTVNAALTFAAHYETRDEDTFALIRGNPERLGPQLRPIEADCTARAAAARAGTTPPPLPPAANGVPACRTLNIVGALTSGGMSMADLANALVTSARRPVVDKTGLSGHYEVTLKYFDGRPENRGPNDQADFFTAVREQLGLRLDPQRSPVRVLVIDHIERPTPD